MEHYKYSIAANKITDFDGIVEGTGDGQWVPNIGETGVYFELDKNGNVDTAIVEAYAEKTAREHVEEFLRTLSSEK